MYTIRPCLTPLDSVSQTLLGTGCNVSSMYVFTGCQMIALQMGNPVILGLWTNYGYRSSPRVCTSFQYGCLIRMVTRYRSVGGFRLRCSTGRAPLLNAEIVRRENMYASDLYIAKKSVQCPISGGDGLREVIFARFGFGSRRGLTRSAIHAQRRR